MVFSLTQLFSIGIVYLTILFGSAYATERGWISQRITRHPAIRVLSIGVFAGAISFNGSLGLAAQYGGSYLLFFFGTSAAFLMAPVLLGPLSRVALTHKLGSLADFFAFRYPAPWIGGIVSLFMLLGVLPLIALQVHAVSTTLHLLNQELSEDGLAVVFCFTMIGFAILFGARHLSTRDKHQGLVVALGLESVIKLLAAILVAWYAVSEVFGGWDGLADWLTANEALLAGAETRLSEGASRSLLLMFFAAAVTMPHVYHILLTENDDAQLLGSSRWGFPLYMALLSACVPFILWGALRVGAQTSPEFYAIGLGLQQEDRGITILAFVGSLAAASGVLIVTTLAIASMMLNHVILPFYRPIPYLNFYSFLITTRRILIIAIILGAYAINRLLNEGQELMGLGIVAFVAALQFLPGLIGAFHWRRGNRIGLLAGLLAGYLVWLITLFFPLVSDLVYSSLLTPSPMLYEQRIYEPQHQAWHFATTLSLIANAGAYIIFSMLTRPTTDELYAANDCMSDSFSRPYQGQLAARSVSDIEASLSEGIGSAAALREVASSLEELDFDRDETRPHALQEIRNLIETNLSSVVGQTIAHSLIGRFLPYRTSPMEIGTEAVHSIEIRLEDYRSQLTGLAAELDALRRYHRQVLLELPTAVCAINRGGEVLTWNNAMELMTGISGDRIVGSSILELPAGWSEMLSHFVASHESHQLKQEVSDGSRRWLVNLHKASVDNVPAAQSDLVIVIEDITESQMLQDQLMHNERLASIGQLAAGVAHEVGNPVTGIACLAQNLRIESEQPEMLEISSQILEQTQRISAILQSLVNFSHGGSSGSQRPHVPVNIRQCTDEAISLLSLSHESGITFSNDCDAGVEILGDPQRLVQVLINILANARDASRPGDEINVLAYSKLDDVCIEVIDQGHGIPAEHIKKVFDPFFTTKDPGQGTGLGLAIVTSIIEEHHGAISASSRGDNKGTRVEIRIPRYERTAHS